MRAHHNGGGGRRWPLRRVRRQAVADALPDSIVLARGRPLWHLLGVTGDRLAEDIEPGEEVHPLVKVLAVGAVVEALVCQRAEREDVGGDTVRRLLLYFGCHVECAAHALGEASAAGASQRHLDGHHRICCCLASAPKQPRVAAPSKRVGFWSSGLAGRMGSCEPSYLQGTLTLLRRCGAEVG
eukprot:scaffold20095_cov62-Phaeocystis_antarctica.AAC.2